MAGSVLEISMACVRFASRRRRWAVIGYDRLEWPAIPALERIHDLARDYINFLHPVRKLVSKTRSGPRVTRRYDTAQTPYHRLLDSGVLSINMTNQLKRRSTQLDPYRLKVQLEHAQRTLATRARSVGFVRECAPRRSRMYPEGEIPSPPRPSQPAGIESCAVRGNEHGEA
jgi:hypothetical protein